MANKEVHGSLRSDNRIALRGDPGLGRDVFYVIKGDTLTWFFRGLAGAEIAIQCKEFPEQEQRPLLEEGNDLVSVRGRIDGKVCRYSFPGHYAYQLTLHRLDGSTSVLQCVWDDGSDIGMGGGEKSGRPDP